MNEEKEKTKSPLSGALLSFIETHHMELASLTEERDQLRTELAAAKEREQGLRDENARLRCDKDSADKLLERANDMLARAHIVLDGWPQAVEWNKDYLIHTNCDDTALSQPPQSPWRPKFKVGDKVLIGIESKVNEIDEIWQPDTSKSPAYHIKGKGYFTECEMSPAPQPPTKGEESHE